MSDHRTEKGVFEMLWDCPYCGTRKLLGKTHRFCPHCGAAQAADARYFPSDTEKVAVHEHIYGGSDKHCPACNTANSHQAEFCTQCGAALAQAKPVQLQANQIGKADEPFQATQPSEAQGALAAAKARPKSQRFTHWGIAGLLGVGLVGGLVFFFWRQAISVDITGHHWTREIRIENYAPRTEDQWCDSLPARAYNIKRQQQIRSYEQVPYENCETYLHRLDQGDGTFREVEERKCYTAYRQGDPIYADYCHYVVDRWQYLRSIKASGQDKNAYWPQVNLLKTGQCQGCERAGKRLAHYFLTLQLPEETHMCEVTQQIWQQAELNARWQLDANAITGKPHCATLQLAH